MHKWPRQAYAARMKKFRIVPLVTEVAEAARRVAASGAADHAIMTADSPNAYPCRHCLRWARLGEHVILFPYMSIPSDYPYSEVGPIFVHANHCQRYRTDEEYPSDFRNGRAFRAYDARFEMIDAVIANDADPEALIAKLFENPQTAFLQARSANRGCYTFEVQRA